MDRRAYINSIIPKLQVIMGLRDYSVVVKYEEVSEGVANCYVPRGDNTIRITISEEVEGYEDYDILRILIHELLHGAMFQLSHTTVNLAAMAMNQQQLDMFQESIGIQEEMVVDRLACALSSFVLTVFQAREAISITTEPSTVLLLPEATVN